MKRKILAGIIIMWTLGVNTAYASVIINEIAWMGTTVSGTNEWIELRNSSTVAVDLSGWRIEADDGSPSIALSGTIAANGYFLIERTDDATVPEITADLVAPFGNGLSNGGETLRLKDSGTTVMDVVVGGVDWVNVGGDNATKETAQRSGSSWVTGAPTPRAENIASQGEVAGASIVVTTDTAAGAQANSTVSGGSSGGTVAKSLYPRANIVVDAGEDKRAFTTFPIVFSGSSTGLYNEPLTRATYRWNFGDGTISDERVVSHVYEFSGEYVVTLEVFLAQYHNVDRLSVSVTNPDISISKVVSGEKGYVELTDRTDREMDLSGWSLSYGSAAPFMFSPNSIILPKKTFLISNHTSGIASSAVNITLRDPSGADAFVWNAPSLPASVSPATISIHQQSSAVRVNDKKTIIEKELPSFSHEENNAAVVPESTTSEATILWEGQPAGAMLSGSFSDNGMKWILVLVSVLLLVTAGFIIAGNNRDGERPAGEYLIIEGSEDNN